MNEYKGEINEEQNKWEKKRGNEWVMREKELAYLKIMPKSLPNFGPPKSIKTT